jgi:hypothetical protein
MPSFPFISYSTLLALPSHPLFSCHMPFFFPTFPSLPLFTYLALPSFLSLCPTLPCFIDAYPVLPSPPSLPCFPFLSFDLPWLPSPSSFLYHIVPSLTLPSIHPMPFFYVPLSPSFLSIFARLALPYHAPFHRPHLTIPCPILSLFCPTMISFSQPPWSSWSNNTLKTPRELLVKETTWNYFLVHVC